MIGPVIRVKLFKQDPKTKSEVRLNDLQDTVKGWEKSRLGIDEHPARAHVRIDVGQEITELKRHLIQC